MDGAVDQFDIRDRFTSISGLDNHHASGKLDLALNWITLTKIDPQDILLIGDTIHDYEVAQVIGIDCILIYSGHQNKERLMECGTTLILSLAELSEVLEFSEAKHE